MGRKLVLTGFMATGKSAVGAMVARRLGWRLVDSDREIELRAGKSIVTIFAEDGEPRFRALEREVIADLAADPRPAVIATGGGALVDDDNYAALSRSGVIICLAARPEVIAARVARSGAARPKLLESDQPIEERIKELLAARSAAYARALATIDTSELTHNQVAERVLAAFAQHGGHRCGASA
jgi:shikimate kinase